MQPTHIHLVAGDSSSPTLTVRWATFADLAPDITHALQKASTACHTLASLNVHEHDHATIAGVVSWMEASYEASAAKAALEGVQEAREKAFRPLASLDAAEISHLFAYHALNKRLLLLTCNAEAAREKDANPTGSGRVSSHSSSSPNAVHQAGAPPLVTREVPTGGKESAMHNEEDPVTGAILAEDAAGESFDKDRFKRMYRLYKPNMLLRLARTWHSCGVHELEVIDERERDARALAEMKLSARAKAAEKATEEAAKAAVERKSACFATLRLAHHLGLSKLVSVAVDSLAEQWLDVDSTVPLLLLADELDCHQLRNRVSGFAVAHMAAVASTPLWRDCLPSWQHTRIFELAAAARHDLHGLMGSSSHQLMGREAAADVNELVIYARETLFNVEERLAEAKDAVECDKGAASEDHARQMIEDQEERIRRLRTFIGEHEHLPPRLRRVFHRDRTVWSSHNVGPHTPA